MASISQHPDPFDIPLVDLQKRQSSKWTRIEPGTLPMWVAEMDVRLADPIRERLQVALDASDTGYAGEPGKLADVFARFAQNEWDWEIEPDLCASFPDLAASGTYALRYFAGDDKRAVIMPPVYMSFTEWLSDADVASFPVPLLANGAPDLAGVREALVAGVRVVLISNPHNPIGRMWRRAELIELAEIAEEHGAKVISDEIHAPLAYPGATFVPFLSVSDAARRVGIALHSASKAFNIAGLKASLVVRAAEGPELPIPEEASWSVGIFGLLAAEVAFSGACAEWLAAVRSGLAERAAHVKARFEAELPGARCWMPEAGHLMWIDLSAVLPSEAEPAREIYERTRVLVSEGTGFGAEGEGCIRLNFGTSREILDDALDRIISALKRREAGANE